MDPYKHHRDAMYNFIVEAIDDNIFDRDQYGEAGAAGIATLSKNFRTYQEFAQHQRVVVDSLDLNSLTFIQQIQNLCLAGKLDVYEEESNTSNSNGGFFFTRDGTINIVASR